VSMKPVEIKAWMGDGTEYVVRYYKEADFDAKEQECEALRKELSAARGDNNRLIAAQSREGRHALRVENERLRELLREAKLQIEAVCYYDYCDDDEDVQTDVAILRRIIPRIDAALKEQP